MIIIRITGIVGGSIEVGRREGTLRVRCTGRRQEGAILRTKTIKPHAHCERLVAIYWLACGVELESILRGVDVALGSVVVPFREERSRAQTAQTVVSIYL
jgi:hypothetical protein